MTFRLGTEVHCEIDFGYPQPSDLSETGPVGPSATTNRHRLVIAFNTMLLGTLAR